MAVRIVRNLLVEHRTGVDRPSPKIITYTPVMVLPLSLGQLAVAFIFLLRWHTSKGEE